VVVYLQGDQRHRADPSKDNEFHGGSEKLFDCAMWRRSNEFQGGLGMGCALRHVALKRVKYGT
jgi:hypothetical protein